MASTSVTLAHATRLGCYELLAPLGAGGMGEVFRALDVRLDREVAVKVLPADLAADRERVARFAREARLLASVHHPGIASIHSFEEAGGRHLLVMELVEGEGLDERISRGVLPLEEALPLARQIAEALEEAHEHGIVHRDLKPANVKVTAEGRAKLLDFGLAKGFAPQPIRSGAQTSLSPTITASPTIAGVILGTAPYMAPEQARGKAVDKRADIWAFGVVLYEMLAGRRLFEGADVSEVLAAVLRQEIDLSALPPGTPASVRRLLLRCLERDPKQRLRDIGEARIALEGGGPEAQSAPAAPAAPRRSWITAAIAIFAAALGALAAWVTRPAPPKPPVRMLELPLDRLQASFFTSPPVISPDGAKIAYWVDRSIRIRRLDDLSVVDVDLGHAGASAPAPRYLFWSIDGASVAYGMDKKIWRVAATGGAPSVVCDIPDSVSIVGGDWGADETIVFASWRGSIWRVASAGGHPEVLVRVDPKLEVDFHFPRLLPDGRGLLFVPHRTKEKEGDTPLEVWSGGVRHTALRESNVAGASYAAGHLLFSRSGEEGIWAVPFSLTKLHATGEPFVVLREGTHPSASADGTLLCVRGAVARASELVWVTSQGEVSASLGTPFRGIGGPALSPDGRKVVMSLREANQYDLWLCDVTSGGRMRLTSSPDDEGASTWSPAGDRVVFVRTPDNVSAQIMSVSAGGGDERPLVKGLSGSVSPDGRWVLYFVEEGGGRGHLAVAPLDARLAVSGPARIFGASDSRVAMGFPPAISPLGDLVAYAASEGERPELFLRSFPSGEMPWQVTTGGAGPVQWSRDGTRLFTISGDDLVEVTVTRTPRLAIGPPRKLFGIQERHLRNTRFDVAADGRFLMLRDAGDPMSLVVAIHGTRLLERGASKER